MHNSISIYPKFQVLCFHIFQVDVLLDEQRAKFVQSEIISTPIYDECNKMYRSKVCFQQFWYIVSGLDVQFEQSDNDNPVGKKNGCINLQVAKYTNYVPGLIYYFFGQLIVWYEPMA